jgi:hypothetical protein
MEIVLWIISIQLSTLIWVAIDIQANTKNLAKE